MPEETKGMTYTEKVDKLCDIDESLFQFSDLRGSPLRDRMMDILSLLGRFSELQDKARLRKDVQDTKVSSIRSKAILQVKKLQAENSDFKIAATLMDDYIYSMEIEQTSVEREEQKLAAYTYAVNRFRSVCDLIKNSIVACQTALNYDKVEIKSLGQ